MRLARLAVLLLSLGCEGEGDAHANTAGASAQGGTAAVAGQSQGGRGGQPGGDAAGAAASGRGAGGAGTAGAGGTGGAGGIAGGAATAGAGSGAGGDHAMPEMGCADDGSRCAVMAVGDSITWGVTDIGFGRGGYRVPLFHLANQGSRLLTFVGSLNDATETGVTVPATVDGVPFPGSHEGHPGWVIQQIADIIGAAIRANHPRIILLMIGTNDMAADFDPPSAPARLGSLLDGVARAGPSVRVVVAQLIPSRDDGINAKIQAYNAAMPGVIEAHEDSGQHVSLVDMYGAFTADADYKANLLQNTLHPNDAGYATMADVWYARIAEMLPRGP